jgi:NADH-quinone oxidoreductase subunit L
VILSICAVAAGFIPFSKFITSDGSPLISHNELTFSIAPVALAIAAILFAASLYRKENDKPQRIAATVGVLYRSAFKKFYIDELYLFITKKIVFNLIGAPAAWIDRNIIDGMMNGIAYVTATTSGLIKGLQSGRVQQYAIYFFSGIVALAVLLIYVWK